LWTATFASLLPNSPTTSRIPEIPHFVQNDNDLHDAFALQLRSCGGGRLPVTFATIMEKSSYEVTQHCRICGNSELDPVLSLGVQYMTGVFPKTRSQKVSSGPLELVKCREIADGSRCGLLQLRHAFNPDEMYRSGYGYRSGINQTMIRHLQEVVRGTLKRVELKPGDIVLDIGSNDSTLLQTYPASGLELIGIDPSGENFRSYYPPHIRLVPDYFSAKAFRSVFGNRKAKVISSIAMFYDLPSPIAFMREIKEVLADDGVWVLEQSYMPRMLEVNAYDTVCHEHLEYYGLRQIKWMTDRVGLKIVDVELNDINGGSFLVMVAHDHSDCRIQNRWCDILRQETAQRLDTCVPYLSFRDNVFRHRDELTSYVRAIRNRQELILGYGASTKGNVILQFCGLTEHDIPAIAERNPQKFGCFTPGTLIPIISEQEARDRHPNYLLALPWHFREEFMDRERSYLESGGKLLFPLPKVETVR